MRVSASHFTPVVLALGVASLACFSVGDLPGTIDEPIPMGTPFYAPALEVPTLGALLAEAGPPVRIGTRNKVGYLTLVVTDVIRPADHIADDATMYSSPKPGEEYLAVELTATCNRPANESCHLSTMDFGASGALRISYVAEITMAGTGRSFESGELEGGKSRSGYLFFVVAQDDRDLVMIYPRTYGMIAPTGSFLLDD